MRWQGRRMSGNIDDRRGGGGRIIGGGIGVLVIAAIVYLLGGDPSQVLQQGGNTQQSGEYQPTAAEQEARDFVAVVLAETEDFWNKQFAEMGGQYREPNLVLFTQVVQSGCGGASASSGPFYCPADEKAYIDLSFYDEMKNKLNAPGDFAMAYVIAHEIGHHVQNLMGTSAKMQELRGRISREEYNQLSVRLELQADFYAGLWAHFAKQQQGFLEEGDIEEALNAANAIGDDRLQKQSQGYVVPDAFTHGTSAQRMRWFKLGYETGDIRRGDTFNTTDL